MSSTKLRERIESFPTWHYEFDLDGNRTRSWNPHAANRHTQRARYFFDPLLELFGGSLAGRRVLDLGCNAGYWSLRCVEAGAAFVRGIDGRRMHIDQANLVFEVKDIDRTRYEFVCSDVFDALKEDHGQFDVVLCLGLLYHMSRPVELFELMSRNNRDVLVIDTLMSTLQGAALKLTREPLDDPRNATDREIVMHPTRAAVIELAKEFGYDVAVIAPSFTDWTGCDTYRDGRRRAFICSKHTPLVGLKTESVPFGIMARPVVQRLTQALRSLGRRVASLRSTDTSDS